MSIMYKRSLLCSRSARIEVLAVFVCGLLWTTAAVLAGGLIYFAGRW